MTACTYLATEDDSNFLIAKSKVADYKRPATVPKMEMNAIAIGARLTLNTYLSLRYATRITRVILLSDSEIALNWTKSPIHHQGIGPYVKNRVKEVYNIVKELEEMNVQVQFGYIDTKQNPADIGTRGASGEEFSSHIWWKAYSLRSISENGISSSFFHIKIQADDQDGELMETFVTASITGSHASDKPKELIDLSRYSSKTKADDSLASSRDKFFEEEVKGVSFDPTFTAEFVRKELEFLEDFCQKIQTEIREAELQLNTETHESLSEEIKRILANLEHKLDEKFEHFSQQQEQFSRKLTDLEHKLDETREHCSQLQEEIKCMLKEPKEPINNSRLVSEKQSHSPAGTPSRRSTEEDLLDLEDDVVFQNSDEGRRRQQQ
ncbi:hypothetical protein OSTOST_12032 [Ostertagia ostertagi]